MFGSDFAADDDRGCQQTSPHEDTLPAAPEPELSPEEQKQKLLHLLSVKAEKLARLETLHKPQQPALLLQSSRAAANIVLLENVLHVWTSLCHQRRRREQLRDLDRRRVAASVFSSCSKLARVLLHISRMQAGAAFTEWRHYNSLLKERDFKARFTPRQFPGLYAGMAVDFIDFNEEAQEDEEEEQEDSMEVEVEVGSGSGSGPLLGSPDHMLDGASVGVPETHFLHDESLSGIDASYCEGAAQLQAVLERMHFASLNRAHSRWAAFSLEGRREEHERLVKEEQKQQREAEVLAEKQRQQEVAKIRSQLEALRAWDQDASQRVRAMGARGLYLEARREELLGSRARSDQSLRPWDLVQSLCQHRHLRRKDNTQTDQLQLLRYQGEQDGRESRQISHRLQEINKSQESLEREKNAVVLRIQEDRAASAALRKTVQEEEEANAALASALESQRQLRESEHGRHQKELQDANARLEHLEGLIRSLQMSSRSDANACPVEEAIETEKSQWMATQSALTAQCRAMEEELEATRAAAALRHQKEEAEQEACMVLRAELTAARQKYEEEAARQDAYVDVEQESCEAQQLAELDHYADIVAKLRNELQWVREEKATMEGDLK
eukprot:CAMPEP_0206619136 /NCGR_PEP_ID=MMETSP0325_2-20121206/60661_1 /ASSEMBLY_ACC=CAM_ASM_000347 /TAXON_ID=2866 /ORGANISM="Crypthecodinium cohnii, Strain Seligo" /LENGTH=613 /DNA_ID=CAMNT_0054141473 /DNA_START=21 /DNA_END=1859 /DNA_ORIENTATION=-